MEPETKRQSEKWKTIDEPCNKNRSKIKIMFIVF